MNCFIKIAKEKVKKKKKINQSCKKSKETDNFMSPKILFY